MRSGEIVAEGTPEAVAADAVSATGFYLKGMLATTAPSKRQRAKESVE